MGYVGESHKFPALPRTTNEENDPVVKHHYETLKKNEQVIEDGKISTVKTMIVLDPRLNKGKPTLIPSLYNGKIYDNEYDAVTQALKTGKKYTTGNSVEELEIYDDRLHRLYIK